MSEELQQRLIALESRMAHYERMAEDLSDVITRQGREIDRLTLHMRRLRDRLGEMEAGWSPSPQDEKPPPHY